RRHHRAQRVPAARPAVQLHEWLAVEVGGPGAQRQDQRGGDRDTRNLPRGAGARVTRSLLAGRRAPGIHLEFAQPRSGISTRRTDITGFAGVAARGPLFTPVRIETSAEFAMTFVRHIPAGYLAFSVAAFFANCGASAWAVAPAALAGSGAAPPEPDGAHPFADGADGLRDVTTSDLLEAVAALEPIEEIGVLTAPDVQPVPAVPIVTDPPGRSCEVLTATP